MVEVGRAVLIMGVIVTLVWWPTDFLVYEREMRLKVQLWRIGSLLTLGPFPLLVTFSRRVRERPLPALIATTLAFAAMFSYGLSRMGDANQPWFGGVYLVPLGTLPLQMRLKPRIALTSLVALVDLAAFFGTHPEHLSFVAATNVFSIMLFVVVVSSTMGHTAFQLLRANFHTERSLERLNGQLEERVRLQTADLRSLATRLERLREEERTMIANELHDDVGQLLTALRYEADSVEKEARRGGLLLSVEDIHFLIDRMLDTFRRILRALRPRALDDFGFMAAAEWLANEHREHTGHEVSFVVDPPDADEQRIDGKTATAAYRVLQEALTNIARHAHAAHVDITIYLCPTELRMHIRDDGCGLPERAAYRVGAMGLIGMRERARSLGGTAEVERAPEGGTRVTLWLPLATTEGPLTQRVAG